MCTYPRQHPSGHEWRKPRRYESVELLPGASGVIAVDALTEWMREHRFVDFLPDFVNMLGVECVDDLQLVTVAVGVPSEGGIATASSFSPAARARPPEAGAAHGLAGGATDADHFIAAVGVAAAAGGGRLGAGAPLHPRGSVSSVGGEEAGVKPLRARPPPQWAAASRRRRLQRLSRRRR